MHNNQLQLGSDIFCQALVDAGVEVVFGIPGGVLLPLYDKINKYGHHIKHILPRHEQGGGFAADGYARATGKTGVAIGTSGPGATNLLTSMANSLLDSVPVVYITGQVATELIGTDAFQETDIVGMSMPVVKHSYFVEHAEDVGRVVKEAFHIAGSGRPGPVHIDFAKNAWTTKAIYDSDVEMDLPGYVPLPDRCCSDQQIKELDQLLEEKDCKPVIIAGHGVSIGKAEKELIAFADQHNIPVISTLLGLGVFPQNHPLWYGMLGMHGDAVSNFAVHQASLVIAIGCRFSDRITGNMKAFTTGTKFVHMEIDPSEIGKNVPIDLPLIGGAKSTLNRANELLSDHRFDDWWAELEKLKQEHGFLDMKYCPQHDPNLLSQPRLVKMISDASEGQAIVGADVGRNQMWTARFYRFANTNSHLSSGGLGSMGYGLPAAMGAKLGKPDREVWAITGDGGFMMNVQELGTLAEYNIGVKIAIMEDSSLGMVRQWQSLLFDKNLSHSTFKNPDFVKLAESFGIPAWRVSTYEEAEKAIEEARKADGPTLITFVVDPNENVYPMVPPNTPLGDQALNDNDLL